MDLRERQLAALAIGAAAFIWNSRVFATSTIAASTTARILSCAAATAAVTDGSLEVMTGDMGGKASA